MRALSGLRLSATTVLLALAAAHASAAPAPVPTPLKAGMTTSTATHRITGLTILPSAPQPDQLLRVRVDGVGTCKVWFGIAQLDGPKSPISLPPSWNPMGLFNELSRPPDATLALPGDLPALRLGAGRWKIAADSHEGFKGSTCRGSADLTFVVAENRPVVSGKPGPAPLLVAPQKK